MGAKLFVGNLPFDTEEDALRQLFESTGKRVAEIAVMKDRVTGRPRGFAFVTMESDEDAQAVISALNDSQFGGRRLAVNEATPRPARPFGGGGGGGGRFDGPPGGFGGGGGGYDGGGRGGFPPKAGGSRRKRRHKRIL